VFTEPMHSNEKGDNFTELLSRKDKGMHMQTHTHTHPTILLLLRAFVDVEYIYLAVA
jgi:hypothetical protein